MGIKFHILFKFPEDFIRGLEFCDFFLQFHKMQIFWAENLSNNKVNIYNY